MKTVELLRAQVAALSDELDRRLACTTCGHRRSVHGRGYAGCLSCDCGAYVEPLITPEATQ